MHYRRYLVFVHLTAGCANSSTADTVYRQGDAAVILCSDGGFVANLATGAQPIEGRFADEGSGPSGANGETGAREFTLTPDNGTFTSIEIGSGWVNDPTAIDHDADVQCSGLESRAWWQRPATALPRGTVFTKPAGGFADAAACKAAQQAGTYPTNAKCEDGLMLCTNNRAAIMSGDSGVSGTYTVNVGYIEVQPSSVIEPISGIFFADGTLRTNDQIWHQLPFDEADIDLTSIGCTGT